MKASTTKWFKYGILYISSALFIGGVGSLWWEREQKILLGEDFAYVRAGYAERKVIPELFGNEEPEAATNLTRIVPTTNYYVKIKISKTSGSDCCYSLFKSGSSNITVNASANSWAYEFLLYIYNTRKFADPLSPETASFSLSGEGVDTKSINVTVYPQGASYPTNSFEGTGTEDIIVDLDTIRMSYFSRYAVIKVRLRENPSKESGAPYAIEYVTNNTLNVLSFSGTNLIIQPSTIGISVNRDFRDLKEVYVGIKDLFVYDFGHPEWFYDGDNFGLPKRKTVFLEDVSQIQSSLPKLGECIYSSDSWTNSGMTATRPVIGPSDYIFTPSGKVWSVSFTNNSVIGLKKRVLWNTITTAISNSTISPEIPLNPYYNGFYSSFTNNDGMYKVSAHEYTYKPPISFDANPTYGYDGSPDGCDYRTSWPRLEEVEIVNSPFGGKSTIWEVLKVSTNYYPLFSDFEMISNSITPGIGGQMITNRLRLFNKNLDTNKLNTILNVSDRFKYSAAWTTMSMSTNTVVTYKLVELHESTNENHVSDSKEALFEDTYYVRTQIVFNVGATNVPSYISDMPPQYIYEKRGSFNGDSHYEYSKYVRVYPDETTTTIEETNTYLWASGDEFDIYENYKFENLRPDYPSDFAITNGYVKKVWIYASYFPKYKFPLFPYKDVNNYTNTYDVTVITNLNNSLWTQTDLSIQNVTTTPDPEPLSSYELKTGQSVLPIPPEFVRNGSRADKISFSGFEGMYAKERRIELIKEVNSPTSPQQLEFSLGEDIPDPDGSDFKVRKYEETISGEQDSVNEQFESDPDKYRSSYTTIISRNNHEDYVKDISLPFPEFFVIVEWNWKCLNKESDWHQDVHTPDWIENNTNKLIEGKAKIP